MEDKKQVAPGWHRLLAADMSQLSARLMVMRLAAQSTDVNVLKIVEDHPCLLLQETFALDSQASQPSQNWVIRCVLASYSLKAFWLLIMIYLVVPTYWIVLHQATEAVCCTRCILLCLVPADT